MTWQAPLTVSIATAQIAAALVVVPLVVRSTAVTVAALAALGMCAAPMTTWAQSLRMRLVPPEAHGRLFALLRTAMQATPPAGAALAALIIGRGAVVTVAAIAATIGVPALVPARDLTGTPGADREPAPAGPADGSGPADAAATGNLGRLAATGPISCAGRHGDDAAPQSRTTAASLILADTFKNRRSRTRECHVSGRRRRHRAHVRGPGQAPRLVRKIKIFIPNERWRLCRHDRWTRTTWLPRRR